MTSTLRRPIVLAVLAGLFLLASCSAQSARTYDLVNQSRAASGLPPLEYNTMLYAKAQAWADRLAAQGYLQHSNLADGNWSTTRTKLGENVAYGPSMEAVHDNLMRSAPHRANILSADYNKVGTGVAYSPDGTVWVVQEFMHEWYVG